MLGEELKQTKHKSSSSLLCCRSCVNSSDTTTTQKKHGGWKAMPYIIGTETFDRLAVFGLLANLMVYLTREFHLDQVLASNIVNIWSGVTNFVPLIGAFISDAYLGRFRTIAFGSLASLLGMIIVTMSACLSELHPPPCTTQQQALGQCVRASKTHLGFLLMGLGFLTLGSAGIRSCSVPFGIDQFDSTTVEGKKGIDSYFNWYYASTTMAMLVTQTVVVYVQSSVSWKIGFGMPTACCLCSIILFFAGTGIYVHVKPDGSMLSSIAQILVAAYKKRQVNLPTEQRPDGIFYDPPLKGRTVLSKLPVTDQFKFLSRAAVIMEGELNPDGTRVNQWSLANIQQVEEVKCLVRIVPIWAANILSLTSMVQQGTFTVSQALKMDRHLGPKFQIPAGSIVIISFITVALWVPFYDRILVPKLRKITKHEAGITLLQRNGIGMVFSVLSMVVAGLIEKVRRNVANSNPTPLGIAPMSVMWLSPQLVLMGLCQAFSIIGQIEFFNRQFPESMRSIGNSLFSCSFAGSNYVNSLLVTILHRTTRTHSHPDWLTNDINAGKLDCFYYLLAGMGALNLIYFLYVACQYHYLESVAVQGEAQKDMEPAS